MKKTRTCPQCKHQMVEAQLKVGSESIYLHSYSGEDNSILHAWICPQCNEVVLKASSPENLVGPDDLENNSLTSPFD
ncbi:MAG: hypothetical protein U5K99_04270 [Anaerolineales bacterium]|nr:hypothetical protein [Anaerolineales bacterium]